MYVMTIYHLIYSKPSIAAIVRQWNNETDSRLLKSIYGAVRKNRQVCDFLSLVDETYCTDMLTFLNKMADFVLHNSYCSS